MLDFNTGPAVGTMEGFPPGLSIHQNKDLWYDHSDYATIGRQQSP